MGHKNGVVHMKPIFSGFRPKNVPYFWVTREWENSGSPEILTVFFVGSGKLKTFFVGTEKLRAFLVGSRENGF